MCFGLRSEHAFGFVTVALTFAIFLIGVLYTDFLVHKVLPAHVGDGVVGGLKVGIGDEAVAFGQVGLVAGDLGLGDECAEAAKGVVEHTFVDHRVKVAHEELGAYFDGFLLVGGGFVDTNGLAEEAHLVHNPSSVVSVLFEGELDEAIALVGLGDSVFGEVDVGYAAGL